jgi:hypothetical protein
VIVIQPTRNNKLVAAVVALLVSASLAGMSLTTASRAPEHAPVMGLAVIPAATRLQRKRRDRAVRSIRLRLVRRLRESKVWGRPRGLNLRPRLSVQQWHARGPPR